jgi:hypothetical protein
MLSPLALYFVGILASIGRVPTYLRASSRSGRRLSAVASLTAGFMSWDATWSRALPRVSL